MPLVPPKTSFPITTPNATATVKLFFLTNYILGYLLLLTLSMARNIAVTQNIPVAFFSLEMSSVQLITRLISSANWTKTVLAYDISKTSFNLGTKLSTKTVIKPQRKNRVVKKMSALLYDLLVDMINFIKYVYFFIRDFFRVILIYYILLWLLTHFKFYFSFYQRWVVKPL